MNRWLAVARDPYRGSVLVLGVLVVAGVGAAVLAGIRAADTDDVASQLPYAVSGGFGGLGLAGFALGLLAVQRRRWAAAVERDALDRMITSAAALLDDGEAR